MSIKTYLVGGAVRDKLLGLQSKDLDYAVEAPSYDAMVDWIKERGKIFLEKPMYWTVRAKLHDGEAADYVLCRKDGYYSDGRRPDSVSVGTLHDDLSRRDFTVNAIAMDSETGEYIDPFGGREHLASKELHCVGNAFERFNEDALRILRAVRFAITKDLKITQEVDDAICDYKLLLKLKDNVSVERKREELTKCFAHNVRKTINYLYLYRGVAMACFEDSALWLQPTTKERT